MTCLMIALLFVAVGSGGFGYSRHGLACGIGPIGAVVITLVTLYLMGYAHG